ncbi:MAG: D-alanyl-D-alanine carboxypeptidase [Rhizobiaceae bacterium]|nr:D-alanyl-D-alanine carboxypeptidase [Rhizobiaceae bacterium]
MNYKLLHTFSMAFISLIFVALSSIAIQAQIYSTKAEQALLLDSDTGTILFAKNIEQEIPPASLAKLMTMEVVFEALKSGGLSLTDTFFVSENAWRKGGTSSGGSTMFAKLNSEIALEDLIRGVIIQSGNDACIVIAEGMAGSEEAFASLMNEHARKLGMTDTIFRNSTGLPDPDQHVSIRDLAKLTRHIISEYPQYYRYYGEREFTWNNINQRNRNPLLAMNIGADGMKTGYTEASGYAIVGSAIRDGQRLITVMSGMKSKRQRSEEARKILDWGFRAFEKIELFADGEVIGFANVYGGETSGVGVSSKGPLSIYLPIGNRDRLKARISYEGPLMPPVEQGQKIATLKVWVGDTLSQETPLYASETVEKGGLQRQATDAIKELLFGWM